MVIRYNNELWSIVEFHHVSPGNWRAFVRTRLKNLKNGRVIEQRFRAGEEVDEVRVEHQNWQFLYVDGDDYIFMITVPQFQVDGCKRRSVALCLPSTPLQ
jgi:elongation factor P